MSELNRSHQKNLFNPWHARPVTVLGCGSVGSQVVLMLAKIGCRVITVYDEDDVRSHNVPMSLAFAMEDIGRRKVAVVAERARSQSDIEITAIPRMYQGETLTSSIVACVDTMEARMAIWTMVRMNPNVDLLLDTRTHERFASIFAIRPCEEADIVYYESRLYPTSATRKQTCGSHGIVYQSALTASLAVRALTAFWSGDTPRTHERILLGDNGTHLSGTETHSSEEAP